MIRPLLMVALSGLLLVVNPSQQRVKATNSHSIVTGIRLTPAQAKTMEAKEEADADARFNRNPREAEQINALATQIHSMKDSRRLVRLVEKQFSKELKPHEIPRKIRRRIVLAEYESVSSPAGLIPDERIADAWDWFIGQVGAPKQDLVNAATVYALRDAHYTAARMMWRRNLRSIWTAPGIYAVGPEGKVDRRGATALEAMDMIYQMSSMPQNLKLAQKLAQSGKLFSDEMAQAAKHPPKHLKTRLSVGSSADNNKVHEAVRHYVREYGAAQYKRLLESFADRLFPAQSQG